MRIIVIGSAESIHVTRWIAFLQRRGDEVTLFTDAPPSQVNTSGDVVFMPLAGWPRAIRYAAGVPRLRRLIRKRAAQVVNLQSIGSNALVAWAVPRTMLVVSPWGSEIAANRRNLKWLLIARALRRATLILTTSRAMASTVVERAGCDPAHVHAVSWGVDIRRRASTHEKAEFRKRFGLPHNGVIVTAIRALAPIYRTVDVVQAFAGAWAQATNLHLVLLRGHDPVNAAALRAKRSYENDVLQCAQRSLGPDAFTFLPVRLDHPEMLSLLESTDIAVSIPEADQRATTVLEALATGAAFLGSDIPAYAELLDDGFILTLLPEPIVPHLTEAMIAAAQRVDSRLEHNRALVATLEDASVRLEEAARQMDVIAARRDGSGP